MKKILILGNGKTHVDRVTNGDKRPYTKKGGKAYTKQLKTEKEAREQQNADRVVIAAREAWDVQQGELIKAVRERLEALGFRFDTDQEFNDFVQERVTSHVIRNTTDNVVILGEGTKQQIVLLTYSTAVAVDQKGGEMIIKIG